MTIVSAVPAAPIPCTPAAPILAAPAPVAPPAEPAAPPAPAAPAPVAPATPPAEPTPPPVSGALPWPSAEPVAPTAPPAPVAGLGTGAAETPEPPPLRYFADSEPDGVQTVPDTTPMLRFNALDTPTDPAVDNEGEVGRAQSRAPEVRLDGSQRIALPDGIRALAERMRSSQQEMAQLSMHMDAWMEQSGELRTELIAEWDADGLRPSYRDLVLRAVARTLVHHRQLNSVLRDGAIDLLADIHVGITTPMDDIPLHVVPDTDQRRASCWRSRTGRPSVSECPAPDCSSAGATIQISSENSRAIASSTTSPGAKIPSSLVSRILNWQAPAIQARAYRVPALAAP